jgi:hypothetical protein
MIIDYCGWNFNHIVAYTKDMTNGIIAIAAIVLFFVAVISPRAAGKIENKTNREAGWLKRLANWFWDPITWWTKKSIEVTRKFILFVAESGKKLRRKLPF